MLNKNLQIFLVFLHVRMSGFPFQSLRILSAVVKCCATPYWTLWFPMKNLLSNCFYSVGTLSFFLLLFWRFLSRFFVFRRLSIMYFYFFEYCLGLAQLLNLQVYVCQIWEVFYLYFFMYFFSLPSLPHSFLFSLGTLMTWMLNLLCPG